MRTLRIRSCENGSALSAERKICILSRNGASNKHIVNRRPVSADGTYLGFPKPAGFSQSVGGIERMSTSSILEKK